MIEYLVITMLSLMIIISLRNSLAVWRNIRYFLAYTTPTPPRDNDPTMFYIIVPLMHEVSAVDSLVDSLVSLRYPAKRMVIILATTSKERDARGNNPTHAAAQRVIARYRKKKIAPRIVAIECTKPTGYVATQIKFAVDTFGAEIRDDDFLLVYNADSSPGRTTLLAADSLLQHYRKQVDVMQQSSLFTKNISNIIANKSFGAAANAIHQSLWTLKHEVTMTRRQSSLSRQSIRGANLFRRLWLARFTVCVGHGLFIRKSYYDKHPLNEDASIEDTQYGLYQSLNRTGVYTIPILENSESPSTLSRVIAQKRTWFNLVFDLTRLFVTKGKQVFRKKEQRTEFVSILLQVATIYSVWFTHSLFLIGTIILIIMSSNTIIVTLAVTFHILYWPVPALLLAAYHHRLVSTGRLRIVDAMSAWVLGAPAILSHSLGPWLAVVDRVRGANSRKKTER